MSTPNGAASPVRILLVEDNPGDVRLTQEVFKEARIANEMAVARDGVEAMAYLRREAPFTNAERPHIVLLDLNLPKMDGRQVLQEMKNDPDLRRIPVVVLSTSQSEADIRSSYDLHANCYIAKPVGLDQFIRAVHTIEDFWLTLASLPPR